MSDRRCPCGVAVIPQSQWLKMTREARRNAEANGMRRHRARGLCSRCYQRLAYRGALADFETSARRWDEIADDYRMLVGEGYPLDVIADRLGMTHAALEKAIERHRDDPRARRPRGAA